MIQIQSKRTNSRFRRLKCLLFPLIMVFFIGGCSDAPTIEQLVDPSTIQFSGEKALATLQTFVTQFPNRNSGEPNNEKGRTVVERSMGQNGAHHHH